MSGIAKYNSKEWNPHNRIVTYPTDEDFLLEIFSTDKQYEKVWYNNHGAMTCKNIKQSAYHAWETYISKNGKSFSIEVDYTAPEKGEYTIELLYGVIGREGANSLLIINNNQEKHSLNGGDNRTNRLIVRKNWSQGNYHIKFELSKNIRFYGVAVKKIVTYKADSYLSRDAILTMKKASMTVSDKVKPSEFSCEILYDTDYKNKDNLTGFVFDYRDELNFYVRDINGDLIQVFGGYISSCDLNSEETILTINGANRFIDGDNRAMMEAMIIGGEVELDEEYEDKHIQKFNTYANAVKYLYNSYEIPIKTNIVADFIEGESYETGIKIDMGSSGVGKYIVGNNYEITRTSTSVELRNKPTANQDQYVKLYDSDWFNSSTVDISDYPTFFLSYGMGDPLKETVKEVETTTTADSGSSTSGDTITVRAKPSCSCSCGSYQWYTRTWKNYCPNCGRSGSLHINPKGVPEVEITCGDGRSPYSDGCDSDFCGVCGADKASASSCRSVKLTPASGSATGSSTETSTSTVTTTTGYDLDNPLLGYIVIEVSTYPEKSAPRYPITFDFTAEAPDTQSSFKGFTPNLLNNISNTSSVDVLEFIRDAIGKRGYPRPDEWDYPIYLRSISLKYHTYEELYNNEGDGDKDYSSCKMILYNAGFRQGTALSPTNLEAVGKTYNDLISTLTTSAKYDVLFIPSQHRENDMVELSMNKPLDSVFTVMEGDNGNIIGLSGMECNPVSDYKNHSVSLFSRTEMVQEGEDWEEQQKYYYVVTRFPDQILRYNEMSVVTEVGDGVSDEEAYYTARKNENFGNHTREALTAVIVGFNSSLKIGDGVDTILQESQYNDRKTLLSIRLDVDVEKAPKIQSTLGLNMIDERTKLMKQFEAQRAELKKQSIVMKETALYTDAHDIQLEK